MKYLYVMSGKTSCVTQLMSLLFCQFWWFWWDIRYLNHPLTLLTFAWDNLLLLMTYNFSILTIVILLSLNVCFSNSSIWVTLIVNTGGLGTSPAHSPNYLSTWFACYWNQYQYTITSILSFGKMYWYNIRLYAFESRYVVNVLGEERKIVIQNENDLVVL